MTASEDARRHLDEPNPVALGSDLYYARIALAQAAEAAERGDFGVGAVAVWRQGDHVSEWRAGNQMMSGDGIVDHAETLALLWWRSGAPADATYQMTSSEQPVQGLSVFGTVEPCPLCACALTNSGAVRSVSTVEDGGLTYDGQYHQSDGGATVLGEKRRLQPAAWLRIQEARTVFELLESSDVRLVHLSQELFDTTRRALDDTLATRHLSPKTVRQA